MRALVGSAGAASGRAFWIGVAVVAAVHWLAAFLPAGVGIEGVSSVAHAEEGERTSKSKKDPRRVPHMQEATFRRLGEAQELMEEEKYDEALVMLQQMLESKRRYNNNERAAMHKLIAHIYFETEDFANTIHHFEQVLAQVPDITEGLESDTLGTLARLYFQEGVRQESDPAKANEWFQKALRTIDEWMSKTDEVGADAHYFIAQVNFQKGDKAKSTEHMERAVQMVLERGDQVKEQWWLLLQALYADSDRWDRVAEIGETMVKDYPKRTNWMTLAGAYGQIDEPEKQLWTLEAAHAGDYLELESDFYTYAGLLLQNEMPNRASKYLQQSFDAKQVERTLKNLRLLGQAYHVGRDVDEAIPVFEEAGELAEDGEPFSRLAALHLQRDENEKCRDAADKALEKGGLRHPLATKATLATCLFNLRELSDARDVFRSIRSEARKSKDTRAEEQFAGVWLTYIESERKRLESIASLNR